MPGDFLDIILLVLCAAFAVAGYRQGFIIGVLSLAGFLGGVVVGAIIAPAISRAVATSPQWQTVIVILVLFAAAVLGMLLASGIGVAVRSRVTARPATFLDSLGGAIVNVVSVLLLAWLLGSLLVNTSFPAVAAQVNGSIVLKTVDRLMPQGIHPQLLPQLRGLLSGTGLYAPIFSAIGEEGSVNLPAADAAVLDSPAVAQIERSVVKIEGLAPSCSLQIEGSGFVISPDHVLTNAHVVAGVTDGPQVYAANGGTYSSQVVLYDPQRDIAVLNVPGLDEPAMRLAGPAPYGANAIVAGYPHNHPLTLVPARVGENIDAVGPNIYENAEVSRQVYAIRAKVEPGNSGGPLVAPDGEVYGVVFAASTSFADTGYALTAAEIASDVQAGEQLTLPVSTQACQGS